jgi:hypothetical protein
MKTRPIKELLELMLENIWMFRTGLCMLSMSLYTWDIITGEEYLALRAYISRNKPKRLYSIDRDYYWQPGNEKPRIAWLNKHIELNGNNV